MRGFELILVGVGFMLVPFANAFGPVGWFALGFGFVVVGIALSAGSRGDGDAAFGFVTCRDCEARNSPSRDACRDCGTDL